MPGRNRLHKLMHSMLLPLAFKRLVALRYSFVSVGVAFTVMSNDLRWRYPLWRWVRFDDDFPRLGAGLDVMILENRGLSVVYGRDLVKFWDAGDGGGGGGGQPIGLLDLVGLYVTRTTALFGAPVLEGLEGLPPVQTPDLSSLGKVERSLQHEYEYGGGAVARAADFWMGTEILNT
ncbi:hypothetical protein F4778DRAFT_719027 [Xylariomycetidae sp. FL2044]|nr:hypothetical protein F4778DRAFT_719027 [Xylariomycetidae sp. FL2044]